MNRENMLIEADELLSKIGNSNLRIYDATILFFRQETDATAHELYQQAHIPGAAFFDHQEFSDTSNKYMYMVLSEAELAEQIGKSGISADAEIVFYTSEIMACATRAWWLLHYAGHNNVRVLNGGFAAWEKAGGEVEQGDNRYESTQFETNLRTDKFASKDDVLKAMENGQVCTVNALTTEIYQNGHITGSSLLPCMDLMVDMQSFRSQNELELKLIEEAQHERVITYCGGGIAATVNAMAHLMAGNKNVAVYDGSMDEWAGEGLPITKKTAQLL